MLVLLCALALAAEAAENRNHGTVTKWTMDFTNPDAPIGINAVAAKFGRPAYGDSLSGHLWFDPENPFGCQPFEKLPKNSVVIVFRGGVPNSPHSVRRRQMGAESLGDLRQGGAELLDKAWDRGMGLDQLMPDSWKQLLKDCPNAFFQQKVQNAQKAKADAIIVVDFPKINPKSGREIVFNDRYGKVNSIKIPSLLISAVDAEKQFGLSVSKGSEFQSAKVVLEWSHPEPSTDPITVEFWSSAGDMDGAKEAPDLWRMIKNMGDRAEFQYRVGLKTSETACRLQSEALCNKHCIRNGRYCATRDARLAEQRESEKIPGKKIMKENLAQLIALKFVQDNYPDLEPWWLYKLRFDKNCGALAELRDKFDSDSGTLGKGLDFPDEEESSDELDDPEHGFTARCRGRVLRTVDKTLGLKEGDKLSLLKAVQDGMEKYGDMSQDKEIDLLEAMLDVEDQEEAYTLPSLVVNGHPYAGAIGCEQDHNPACLASYLHYCPEVKYTCDAFADAKTAPEICQKHQPLTVACMSKEFVGEYNDEIDPLEGERTDEYWGTWLAHTAVLVVLVILIVCGVGVCVYVISISDEDRWKNYNKSSLRDIRSSVQGSVKEKFEKMKSSMKKPSFTKLETDEEEGKPDIGIRA